MSKSSETGMESFSYIVVGGGISGVTCVEQLYTLNPNSHILLLTATDVVKAAVNILPVTKYLDDFDVVEQNFKDFQHKFSSVKVMKSSVTYVDSSRQVVQTSSGKEYYYKKLCICSGASANSLDPKNPYILSIRDTESVIEFQKRISKAKRIMIIGNGGIATEMVYELAGIEVIWVIKDTFINSVFIDPGAAEFLKPQLSLEKDCYPILTKRGKYIVDGINTSKNDGPSLSGGALGPDWHTGLDLKGQTKRNVVLESGVEIKNIYYGDKVTNEFLINQKIAEVWPVYVKLTNNKIYGCDFIISATGVTPNTTVFRKGNNFNIGTDGGLVVNNKMETSVPNIYAAGDVCSAGWEISKHWHQLRLWTQARQMGCYAAKCMWSAMTGEEIYMDFCFEMFSHVTKFFGKKVILLGLYNGQTLKGKYECLLRMQKGLEYIKCVMVDGKMQGAVLIGETNLEETLENLILNQMDLTVYGEDLLDPNIDIEDYFD